MSGLGDLVMRKNLEVVYENGVFRPLEPVDFPEHQRILVTVEDEEDYLDTTYMEQCTGEADMQVSLEMVRQALAKIPGSLTLDFIAERAES